MEIAKTIKSMATLAQSARSRGETIGLVPTMGALHIGHISLIKAARSQTDFVVVSIFVNPSQFGPKEDLETYPRPFDADLAICKRENADVVFAPTVEEMYPHENLTCVKVEKLTEPLCGRDRPWHFPGVTTVCTKLFNIVRPDIAFFGQKDAQQAIVVKQMVADLNIPLEIAVCPTVREPSGLAVSSRNKYLTKQQKKDAALLYAALKNCENMIHAGTTDAKTLIARMTESIRRIPSAKIDYISIVDAGTLGDIPNAEGNVLIALAVRFGKARLIDNILLDLNKSPQ